MVKELATCLDICGSPIARTDISRQNITNIKTKPCKLFPGEIKAVMAVILLQETCIPSNELRCKILNTENNHEYFEDPTN